MDEPTEGLAPPLVREVGYVLVEQNLPLALRIADHVHVLSRGRIVCSGVPEALAADQEVKARYLGV